MTDEKSLSMKNKLALLSFGFKTAHKWLPAYYPLTLLRSLIMSLQPMAVLFFSARILNELSGERNTRMIIMYVVLTLGLTFLLSVLKAFLVREIETRAGWEQALRRIQMIEAERFATMDFSHTEDSKVSEILARMDVYARSTGRGIVNMYVTPTRAADSLFSLIFAVFLLLGSLSASTGYFVSGTGLWTLVLFAILAAGLVIMFWNRSREAKMMRAISENSAQVNTMADYYFHYVKADEAAKDIRIYDQKSIIHEIAEKSLDFKPWISFFIFEGRIDGFFLALLAIVAGGFYLLVGYGSLNGVVPVGSIVQTVGAVTALTSSVGALIAQIGSIYNNTVFLQPMKEFLSLPDVLEKGSRPVSAPVNASGHAVEFRNVSFRYPGTEKYALSGLNLKMIPGERLAVVGLNGSGKTTMVKLLCRLYDPTEGEVLLDDVNIKEYEYGQYTALFSVVFQDFKLFPLPLGQNVAAGEDYDAIVAGVHLEGAGFADRLKTMQDGLETVLYKDFDENGTTVSGGEAQKIALARALYKDAPIVVLDEPTAALDPIAEYEVYTTFDRTIGGKTAVFISHRLSSCRFCHRIAVFDEGRLVQLGTHDELLTDVNGRYRELWEAQASHYRDEAEES